MNTKAKELRDLSMLELRALYNESARKLYDLKNELKYQKKCEQPHLMKLTRKTIARILTIISEKERAGKSDS